MKNTIIRDGLGRISGSVNDYWINEESYYNYKERELVFPRHNQGKSSPVKVFHISELNKN
jgi:ribosomal protein L15E